jgi:hypothetical protein
VRNVFDKIVQGYNALKAECEGKLVVRRTVIELAGQSPTARITVIFESPH